MVKASSHPNTKPSAFLNAVARVHLSHLFQDPFVAAAFKAAEDDGLATDMAEVDLHPKALDGGAAEVGPGHRPAYPRPGGSMKHVPAAASAPLADVPLQSAKGHAGALKALARLRDQAAAEPERLVTIVNQQRGRFSSRLVLGFRISELAGMPGGAVARRLDG
jgi:hypothetical protein